MVVELIMHEADRRCFGAGDRVRAPNHEKADVPDGWVQAILGGRHRPGVAVHMRILHVLHDRRWIWDWFVLQDGRYVTAHDLQAIDGTLVRVNGAPRLSMFDHPVPSVRIVVEAVEAVEASSTPRRKRASKMRRRS